MKTKRFLSILLTLAMLVGMFPGMSLTASAADSTTTITSPATTGTMTITLDIAAASVKTAPEANTLTYSGSAQTLTTTGEAGVGTLQYQLGESATTEPTGTWGTTVPQGTEAKDYYVWYRSRVNDNNISTAGCKTVTIAKASITNATVTLSDTSLVYTGSEQSVTVSSVKLGDTTLTANTDYEITSGTTGTAKNTYTVTVTGKGNYKDTATAQWSIGLATPTIETIPTASAITYGQKLADSTLTGGAAKLGDTTVAGTFTWKNTETKPAVSDSNATEYDVVFTPTDADNYAAVECKVKLTVNKADPTVTAPTAKALTYNGSAQELVNAGSTEDGTLYYAVTTENKAPTDESLYTTSIPTATNAGTYYVWYKVVGDENHSPTTPTPITVVISPEGSSGTPSEKQLVYNGSAQNLVTEGTALGGTMYYALGEDETTAPAFYLDEAKTQINTAKWSTSVPTGTNAGTYYVWYMVKGDANYNDSKPECVKATIAKKGLTVTADAKSKTVGEADPALAYTVTGLVGTDVMSGALSRDAGEAAGTYQITQGTLTAGDNYAITFIPAVLTIQEAPSSGGGGGGGGVYYGGGTVSSQPQAPYSQVIGATATSYGDSSPERIHNIELACEKLNGIIVEPGEVFSFNEAIGSLTADSGFEIAPVYPGDEATAVMGGGVSQVASTLYASSLFGLLETVERSNHEYAVPFAQAGVDADVSNPAEGGGLDLKFRNNRNEPIKIVVTSKVDEAKQIREITVELRSVLSNSDYMPVRFDNSKSGEKDGVLFADVLDPTRPGYRIVLDHEEQSFTDANGSGIRTLTHRKILDAGGWLVKDEILNARLPDGSYAMDTYYTKG